MSDETHRIDRQALDNVLAAFEDVMEALSAALDGDDSYAERPAELVWKLRDERDTLSQLLSEATEWKTITPETMPEKETAVLAYLPDDGRCYRVVRWTGSRFATVPGEWSVRPSHWMPLPSPPSVA